MDHRSPARYPWKDGAPLVPSYPGDDITDEDAFDAPWIVRHR
nr:hypothetical protein [Mycobacterium riyadhense]